MGTREDDRFFWVSETLVGAVRTIVSTPKSAEAVAQVYQSQIDAKKALLAELRECSINRVNGIAARMARRGNTTILAITDDVVDALIELSKNLPTTPDEFDQVVAMRYATIVMPLQVSAPELLSAFQEMNI